MEKRPLNQLQEKKSLSCTTLVRSISLSSFFFSEPFDAASWMLVGLAAVQISAFSIFLFEWLSPAGYDMKVRIKGGFPAYFSTLIKFPRNNQKLFNFMTTSILPFFVIKKVKSSSSPSQLATFSDFSVPSELWDALCQWSPQSYISLKLITTSLQRDNRMIDSGVKWPLLVLVCDISRANRSFFLREAFFVRLASVHAGHLGW